MALIPAAVTSYKDRVGDDRVVGREKREKKTLFYTVIFTVLCILECIKVNAHYTEISPKQSTFT